MAETQPSPLVLCMENVNGEEVALSIEPTDDFQTFLLKAKSTLGFDVDINSVTRNQPVSLSDNIYQFLMRSEHSLDSQMLPSQTFDQVLPSESFDRVLPSESYSQVLPETFDQLPPQSFDPMLEPSNDPNDLVYELDDGTQIRASQIHFDNEDPHVDLSAEKIPFVKYTDDVDDFEFENVGEEEIRKINIVESPVSRCNKECSPKRSFANTLPFKLVCNNTSAFEAQFTKYLESSVAKTYTTLNPVTARNKSPRSLIRDNYKSYDDKFSRGDDFTGYTREEVLNMFKDSPVASLPYEGQSLNEKRRHVRKSDPSRSVHKSWNAKPVNYDDVILIGDTENQNCIICGKFVENKNEKLYVFDNEDQKRHRASPQKRTASHLKIICEGCLEENFKPGRMKGPNQSLSPDEYLVIRNNQQYIFQKTKKIDFKTTTFDAEAMIDKDVHKRNQEKEKVEFVKVEIGSDGEIVTKPIDNDPRSTDDVIIVKDEDKEGSSSDVEIVEPPEIDENIIDNLDDADEDVKEFLGKYQADNNTETELKCRFCQRIFAELCEVIDHREEHKHDLEEGVVFPCPLCDYGYSNSKWLMGHLKAAHDKSSNATEKPKDEAAEKEPESKSASPIAKRTRSSSKKTDNDGNNKESPTKPSENTGQLVSNAETADSSTLLIKTEVKQEALASSDDEIWIVQTGDDDATKHLENLLHAAKGCQNGNGTKKIHKCSNCNRVFTSKECLSSHKCRITRRGRKRKSESKDDIYVPTQEDFLRRAQGRPRTGDDSDDMMIKRPRRKKNKEPSSDPQIVTCHNCNESFTSKVRLKFHMQFHESTTMRTDGNYTCSSCPGVPFATETALFDHVHFQHHRRRRWHCPVARCGKSFYLRATLTKHSRTHTDTRRYVCVTCGKRFLDKQTLDEHGVTHLQIKPFQCHICMKQLTRRSRLRMHLRAHEEELTPTLVLVCALCSRAFRDHDAAAEHATKSTECIEAFAKEVKEEAEEATPQLSPTSGLVRDTEKVAKSPSPLSMPIPRQVSAALAEALLARLSDAARGLVRVVEIEKAFRCEYCEDVFYLEDALNSHRAIHKDVKNPFTCHICKVSFATYSRCTTHKTTHGFYKRSLAEAKKNASKPSEPEAGPSATGILGYGGFPVVKHFLCEDCGRSYLHWTYLQVHRRMKHANDFLYKCNHCDLTFPNSWSLAYHRKKIHGQTGQGDANSTTKIPREDYRIPCRDCEEVLPNKTALYKHRKKEHSDMTTFRENDRPNDLWCGSCGAVVPSRSALAAHARAHATSSAPAAATATGSASCAQCGDSFANTTDMQKHVDTQCRRRAHACPVCAHTFRSASVRDEHLRTHTGERPFPCDVCGMAFRRSTAMRNHRLIHSDVRMWACARCPKRFRVRSDLRTHARTKHPARLAVIEIRGLNPTPDEVMEYLKANNISHEKVIEITKMSFAKGTSSIIPNCARALSMLGNVPRTQVAYSKPALPSIEDMAKLPHRPAILQRCDDPPPAQAVYPVALSVTGGALTDMDVQMLLRDGVLVNGNQMVQLQLDDNMLLE